MLSVQDKWLHKMDDLGVTVDCACSVLSWCMACFRQYHEEYRFLSLWNCMAGTVPLSMLLVVEKVCAFSNWASSCACAQYVLWLYSHCCTMAVRLRLYYGCLWLYYGCMLMAVVLELYYVCTMIALHNEKSRLGSCSIADFFVFSFQQTLRCDSWYHIQLRHNLDSDTRAVLMKFSTLLLCHTSVLSTCRFPPCWLVLLKSLEPCFDAHHF